MVDRSTSGLGRSTRASRSLGLKLMVILILIVLMAIPVMFISFISFERSSRADEVTREVSQIYGGQQRILGPVLIIPYRETLSNGSIREGDFIVSAATGDARFDNITVEEKSRSLYKVPIYTADGVFQARWSALDEMMADRPDLQFDPDSARIVVGLSDVTGLQSDVTLDIAGSTVSFEPHSGHGLFDQMRDPIRPEPIATTGSPLLTPVQIIKDPFGAGGMTLMSVPVSEWMTEEGLSVEAQIRLSGATRLSLVPFASSTTLMMTSDWPHPGFAGRFPPGDRKITDAGFSAEWSIPYLRRGLPANGRAGEMTRLIHGQADIQVNFVSPLNPYQTVNRALKYAVLFIGLVFLAYFLMETLLTVRVHPAQYLLIGIAQAVFYLLLLAFAEHIGFTLAFVLSAVATVILTAGYAGAVFGRSVIWKSALVFAAVYSLLFILMRIQDFALMVGALVSFLAIAATLYLTRNLDWYGDKMTGPES